MGLLDDLKDIIGDGPPNLSEDASQWVCSHCRAWVVEDKDIDADDLTSRFVHDSGCPWLSMPKIVAALEAAQAYIAEMEGQGERVDVLLRIRTYQRMVDAFREVVPSDQVLTG